MRIISAGGTQLLSNQKGKEKDKITDFSKRAVIEIK
jgi:hypothetical protein